MTLPDVHLAGEAVAALVDGELATGARERALGHLRVCGECRQAVRAQREAAAMLGSADDPPVPAGLMARLRDVPMTTELSPLPLDSVLALDGEDFVWGRASSVRTEEPQQPVPAPQAEPQPEPVLEPAAVGPVGPGPHTVRRRGRWSGSNRPAPGRPGSRGRSTHVRRVLAGAVVGLAFSLFASAAPTATAGLTGGGTDRTDLPTEERNIAPAVNRMPQVNQVSSVNPADQVEAATQPNAADPPGQTRTVTHGDQSGGQPGAAPEREGRTIALVGAFPTRHRQYRAPMH